MFIGIAVGPMFSSLILQSSGDNHPLVVFYFCIIMRTISILYLKFVPESLHKTPDSFWRAIRSIYRPPGRYVAKRYSIFQLTAKVSPVGWMKKMVPSNAGYPKYYRLNVALLVSINILIYACAIAPSDVLILYPQVSTFANRKKKKVIAAEYSGRFQMVQYREQHFHDCDKCF
jgi:MFS family permease